MYHHHIDRRSPFVFHRAITNTYESARWNKHRPSNNKKLKLTPRVHYRQVVVEAGYTLEQLSGTRELLTGARDVFRGMS